MRTAAGIDISDRSIEVVSLLHSKGGVVVQRAGRRELPGGVIERGVIRKPVTLEITLSALLDDLFGARRGKLAAGVSLPASVTYARTFAFPATLDARMLRQAAALEAADAFPVSVADAVTDALVDEGDGEGPQMVRFAAAPRAVAAQYRDSLVACGVVPLFFDGEDYALTRGLDVVAPPEPVLVADVGDRVTQLVLTDMFGVRMSAVVPYGTARLAEAVEKRRGVSYADARAVVQHEGIAADAVLQQPADALVRELRRTLAYAESRLGIRARAVVLAGGGSMIPGLAEHLTSRLAGIPVGRGKPLRGIDPGGIAELSGPEAILYAEAIGLASRALGSRQGPGMDFSPDRDRSGLRSAVRRFLNALTSPRGMVTPRKKPAAKKKTTRAKRPAPEAVEEQQDLAPESSAPSRAVLDMTPPEFAARADAPAEAPADEPDAPEEAETATDMLPEDAAEGSADDEGMEEDAPADEPDFGLGIGDILRSEEEEITARPMPDDEATSSASSRAGDDGERLMIDDILHRNTEEPPRRPIHRPAPAPVRRAPAPTPMPAPVAAPAATAAVAAAAAMPRQLPPAAPAPMRQMRQPSRSGGFLRTFLLILLVLLCFCAAAAGVYVFLKKSGASIFPPIPAENNNAGQQGGNGGAVEANAPSSVTLTFVTGPDAVAAEGSTARYVPSRIIETDVQGSGSYDATGETTVSAGRAAGTITVTNTTANEYTFVATTRFLSADGVLFRLRRATVIPANGTVDAEVAADQTGPEGDIGPTTFTIPGLPADLQRRVTGKSTAAMTGGSGRAKAASEKDIADAKAALLEKLKAEALQNFEVMIDEGEKLHADLVTSNEISSKVPTAGTVGSSFTVEQSLRFRVLLIPEKSLSSAFAEALREALPAGASLADYTLGTATYAVQAYDAATETAEIKVELPVIPQR